MTFERRCCFLQFIWANGVLVSKYSAVGEKYIGENFDLSWEGLKFPVNIMHFVANTNFLNSVSSVELFLNSDFWKHFKQLM